MAPQKGVFGLNLSKAKAHSSTSSTLTGQKRKRSIWDDPDSEDEDKQGESNDVEITTLGGLSSPSETPKTRASGKASSKNKQGLGALNSRQSKPEDFRNLAAMHTSRKHADEAAAVDPSIYDYDAVYDSLHTKSASKPKETDEQGAPTSKYMTALLRSADVRKGDQLRARDKLLAREREAEGDEFADKEKFVTAAYKAQQEEARLIEAEEKEKEKLEAEKRKKGLGMMSFYKDMLKRDEQKHEETMKSAEEAVRKGATTEGDEESQSVQEKSAAQIAAELNAKGAKVAINDEGEVVDKRQLLSAGLNVVSKPKPKGTTAAASTAGPSRPTGPQFDRGARSNREAQRARQTEMLAQQLELRLAKEKEEEEARQRELAEKSKSKRSEGDVMSAKERYLARKRERENAKGSDK
ncbi:hypothetical protein FQN57_004975 [Myotisia sp. PD_48]|nr:hypothetical protein FQN57_004975 [Myotisia sp. PD_48]